MLIQGLPNFYYDTFGHHKDQVMVLSANDGLCYVTLDTKQAMDSKSLVGAFIHVYSVFSTDIEQGVYGRIAYVWKNFGIDYVSWAQWPGLDTPNQVRVPGSIKLAWAQWPALDTANNPVQSIELLLSDPDPNWGTCWLFQSSIIGGADEAAGSLLQNVPDMNKITTQA
ncbi:hypothetical protein SELMODRAFT_410399 [Selaginella moellendorffii]|uniref:Uncharacterized protein n=1 Tax=Selaginella moellendorffii TaxID=88036 RepID=D8REM1_SELML|nr:hypothetical protein SELMODRAFT_410399 [Selaginella moellendorffii]